jgi:hypothetical protein
VKHEPKRRDASRWTLLLVAVAAVSIAILLDFRTKPNETTWMEAKGVVQDARVVPVQATQTLWGAEVRWGAEYVVTYAVNGRAYSVQTDSGIRRESEAEVKLALPKNPPECSVRYSAMKPEISTAECH